MAICYMAIWLYGYMAIWLYGYMALWYDIILIVRAVAASVAYVTHVNPCTSFCLQTLTDKALWRLEGGDGDRVVKPGSPQLPTST